MSAYEIVFVCTGNICRSPMAAVMARAAFAEAGLGEAGLGRAVVVHSAGTGGWHAGDGMDPRAARELAALGLPTEHTAQQLNDALLGAHLLVALDSGHRQHLLHAGVAPERVRLLRSFDPNAHTLDVADPYYGSQHDFAKVRVQVAAALPGLVEFVATRAPGA